MPGRFQRRKHTRHDVCSMTLVDVYVNVNRSGVIAENIKYFNEVQPDRGFRIVPWIDYRAFRQAVRDTVAQKY